MNALNTPSISAEDAPKLKPYMKLSEQLGSFAGQITDSAIKKVNIAYEGSVTEVNTKPLTAMLIANVLKEQTDTVNMVNAMNVAEARGIELSETKSGSSKDWRSVITVTVETCLLYTSPSPRDKRQSRMPSSA